MGAVYIKILKRPGVASAAASQDATGQVFAEIRQALLRGESVSLPGVGRLEVQRRPDHTLHNPRSGQQAVIPGDSKVVYQPARSLIRTLNRREGGGPELD